MSLYEQYQQQAAAAAGANGSKPRVVADGWGASGSVFCADSSLRFLYESHAAPPTPGTAAAAISSLASGEFVSGKPGDLMGHSHSHGHNGVKAAPSAAFAYDKLTAAAATSGYYGHSAAAKPLDPASAAATSSTRGADGVDLFEAEIARACAAVTRQAPSLPHSFRECSVCLTQNAYAQIALCGHTFHSKCFLRWFRTNRSCPLCRGPVDKVQCAPVLSVQDELEALMAEMDDGDDAVGAGDPLMENPDLMSLLGGDFGDADMDMMPLDDLHACGHSHSHTHSHTHDHSHSQQAGEDDDVSMDDEEDQDQHEVTQQQRHTSNTTFGLSLPMAPPPPPPQFAPSSTMPNYWNVLNQGLALPPVMPTPILPTPAQQQQLQPQPPQMGQHRMVHIAPKPDGHVPALHAHHHTSHIYGHAAAAHPFATAPRAASPAAASMAAAIASPAATAPAAAPRVVSCRCTGGCRNGRCACVKEGGMCGAACRCTSCKNPFLMVKAAGADIDALLQDACFMHNVSKTRDMVARMQEPVEVPCCARAIKVIDCVQGYTCAPCARTFDFSWCMNKLLDHDKTPRNHCDICKRCCDHRDVHCDDCGRCYFAGVAASLPCPCKESSRKRRDHHSDAAAAVKEDASAEGEEKEGECSIM